MNNDFLPNSVVLSLGCTLELPGECLKIIKKWVTAQKFSFHWSKQLSGHWGFYRFPWQC